MAKKKFSKSSKQLTGKQIGPNKVKNGFKKAYKAKSSRVPDALRNLKEETEKGDPRKKKTVYSNREDRGWVKKRDNPLKRAPEVYKIHAQQLSKEGKASKSKGTLRKGKSPFRKDITKATRLINPITAAKKVISKVAPRVKKEIKKTKSYFFRHGGTLHQHD